MGKRSSAGKDARRSKLARESTEGLTFLEQLALRALPVRRVPAESGVQFAISSKAKDDGICLIFRVDDAEAPIVKKGPRPDYLVFHLSRQDCLITIIEMKGTEEKGMEHGIEQIRAMHRLLREEMAKCLPGSWRRACIQAVLLMPQNAHINWKRIEEARKEGIEILPLQYHHQAELYPYISKRISRTDRYSHEKLPRDKPEMNPMEQLIAEGRLAQRVRDGFFAVRRGGDEDTFFLSFRRPGDPEDAYMSLSAMIKDAVIAFSPAASKRQREVTAHLKKHGLQCPALHVRSMGTGTSEPAPSGA